MTGDEIARAVRFVAIVWLPATFAAFACDVVTIGLLHWPTLVTYPLSCAVAVAVLFRLKRVFSS